MAKKSILYIITKSVWGGAAKYVFDLATHLPKDKFTMTVAAGGKGKFAQKIIEQKIPYFTISNFQRRINPFKDFFAFFEILSLLFQLKPDVIHVNSSKAGGLTGVAALFYKLLTSRQLRLIFTAHGWAFNEDRPNWQISLIKFFSKLTALFYNKIICVSQYDQKTALKNKIAPADKLITIHNGLDIEEISFLSRGEAQKRLLGKVSLPAGELVIGTIAEWTKNKGLFYLLEATREQKDAFQFNLVLIGSGENPDREKIYDFVKKHNLKNIYLFEWLPDAASYLKGFDIFVLPSIKEGLPYTILEAILAEVPIIATEVGGVPEIIKNNLSGLLIKPKNPELLGEKILYLINNPAIAQKMAKKAKEKIVKEFTLEKMLQETAKIYQSLN